jgi:hypothetical protein
MTVKFFQVFSDLRVDNVAEIDYKLYFAERQGGAGKKSLAFERMLMYISPPVLA